MWVGRLCGRGSHMVFRGERTRISHRHQSIDKVYRTLTANLLLMTGKDQKKIAEPHGEAGKLKSLGEIPQLAASVCCILPQHTSTSAQCM